MKHLNSHHFKKPPQPSPRDGLPSSQINLIDLASTQGAHRVNARSGQAFDTPFSTIRASGLSQLLIRPVLSVIFR
ncbi:MAG: hypothetical protein B7X64_04080 [Halothiobacillus sp. 39-53-45]|jgi:hypothetical protein|nr:MAG: hypothetical protein B7X64_04080 [Halothiobacillus sp. 39-53-45]